MFNFLKEKLKSAFNKITHIIDKKADGEKEKLTELMKHLGHQVYFLCTQRDLCDESIVLYIKNTHRMYLEYKRIIGKIQ